MMSYIWVAVGGAAGSVARFWCSGMVTLGKMEGIDYRPEPDIQAPPEI